MDATDTTAKQTTPHPNGEVAKVPRGEAAGVRMPLRYLPIEDLAPCTFNPRGTALGDLVGLRASIKERGVISPLLVRPLATPSGDEARRYEVVCGHRRLAACKAEGITLVPCVVRVLTDQEVLEAQISENADREEIHPLDEAQAFRTLNRDHGIGVTELAAKVGRTPGAIYQRLRLNDLCREGRELFRKGGLTVVSALAVARIPDQDLQKEVVDQARRGMTPADVQALVQSRYMVRLSLAPFDIASTTLHPAAGACPACPKRTGNQRELFSDVKSSDTCTDPTCYRKKADLAWKGMETLAVARGWKVMTQAEVRALLVVPGKGLDDDHPRYVALDQPCSLDPKRRTWKQLLGKAEVQVYVARDPDSRSVHNLVRRAEATQAGAVNGHGFLRKDPGKAADAKVDLRKRALPLIMDSLAKQVGQLYPELVQVLALALIDRGGGEALAKRSLSDDPGQLAKRQTPQAWLRDLVAKAGGPDDLNAIFVELVLGKGAHDVWAGYDPGLLAVAKERGVDVKACEARAKKAGQEEAQPAKKKTAAKAKRK